MDIGCYGISVARFIFGGEPAQVAAVSDTDPGFGTDRLTSAVLQFDRAVATLTCATQLARHQRVDIVGSSGRIEIEIPFNPPADRATRLWLHRGADVQEIAFEPCNQYTMQGDLLSAAILNDSDVPTPIVDALANMQVLDAVRKSAARHRAASIQSC